MTSMYASSPTMGVCSIHRKKPAKSIARHQSPRTTLFGAIALFLFASSSSTGHVTTAASSTTADDALYKKSTMNDGRHTAPFLTRHLEHDTYPSTLTSPSIGADHEGVSSDGAKKGHGPLLSSAFSRLVQDTFSSSTTSSDTIDIDEKNEGGVVKESIEKDHSVLRKTQTRVVAKDLDEKKDDNDSKKMMTQDMTNSAIRNDQITSNRVSVLRDDSSLVPESTDRSLEDTSTYFFSNYTEQCPAGTSIVTTKQECQDTVRNSLPGNYPFATDITTIFSPPGCYLWNSATYYFNNNLSSEAPSSNRRSLVCKQGNASPKQGPSQSPTASPTAVPSASPTIPPPYDFDIARYGDVQIENATDDSTDKVITIEYELADVRFDHEDVNITIFEDDCLTAIGTDVLPRVTTSSNAQIVKLGVTYDPAKVGESSIWNPTYNEANPALEIGGNFTFCVRAATIDGPSNYEMDFNETKFFVNVDKTTGAGFSLSVDIDRDEVGDENAGTVDYSGSVEGFQCDVNANDFVEKKVTVTQGEALGLCVKSTIAGILVAGWQSLTLKRDGVVFDAVESGSTPSGLVNLVDTNCSGGRCDAEVELIALFFRTDGQLEVEGTVVLEIDDTARRQLVKVEKVITRSDIINEQEYPRMLDEQETAAAGFDLSVALSSELSTPSGSISFGPSTSSYIVSLMTLFVSATMMVANAL